MTSNTSAAAIKHETPIPSPASDALYGSDVIAGTLRALDIDYIALNPGASYRGLHDSLGNYLGNKAPQMVLCLHDELLVHAPADVADDVAVILEASLQETADRWRPAHTGPAVRFVSDTSVISAWSEAK